jgi:hypothetical protein
MEDLRRKPVDSTGLVDAICTLCELEGRPYVRADHEYVVVSTMNGNDFRMTACPYHAGQLDRGVLTYKVARRRKGVDWEHPL